MLSKASSSVSSRGPSSGVLILVLMEYALEGRGNRGHAEMGGRLNPCFNGICSRSLTLHLMQSVTSGHSLNPCFNGICSRSAVGDKWAQPTLVVLILVLMEYALEGK